ncbi:MAG: hypothetical protein KGJ86_00940 [Chloroflexota bacterium]|nr:hypothetical protein [Chloroflexota bacterium]
MIKALVLAFSALLACSGAALAQTAPATPPRFSHVFLIVMENHTLANVLANPAAPTFRSLARQGAVADAYYGLTHPSEPNYLGLLAGDTFGVHDDGTDRALPGGTLVDSLESAGYSWKGYFEGLPEAGANVGAAGRFPADYAKKHNPFMLFAGVAGNPARRARVVPLTQLQPDAELGDQPDFSLIVPNECNDMHSCGVAQADAFLSRTVAEIQASPAWDANAALFVTFDEGVTDAGCCGQTAGGGKIGLIALSPSAKPGYVSWTPYNHYSLLRTIEDSWGLPLIGHSADPQISPMADLFSAPAYPAFDRFMLLI